MENITSGSFLLAVGPSGRPTEGPVMLGAERRLKIPGEQHQAGRKAAHSGLPPAGTWTANSQVTSRGNAPLPSFFFFEHRQVLVERTTVSTRLLRSGRLQEAQLCPQAF